jgi:hypothetical protein
VRQGQPWFEVNAHLWFALDHPRQGPGQRFEGDGDEVVERAVLGVPAQSGA